MLARQIQFPGEEVITPAHSSDRRTGPMIQADSTMPTQTGVNERPFVSVVTPAYNEAQNVPVLFERLSKVMKSMELDWEWIVVDDDCSIVPMTPILIVAF
jgi:hypothetical protein